MPSSQNVHDAVEYGGFISPDTHPNQLSVMGLLHGLLPAPVSTCRVLEVGCNEGRNLIPMAAAIPSASFVGFDLAGDPIARGRERVERLGLGNVRLFQADLMEVLTAPGELGMFDYIIAHGVYAWVPDPVRDSLLALCRKFLNPDGIAYISYNALPGGHVRSLVRDILLEHLPHTPDRLADVSAAMDFLEFVILSRPEGDPIRSLLGKEMEQLQKKGPNIVFHDELSEGFRPVSFRAFAAHAQRHDLQYICEAVIPPPTDPCFHPGTAATVKALAHGDAIAEEQSLDFLRMRMFRETLLCRADRPAHRPINLDLDLRSIDRLRLAALVEVAGEDLAKQSDSFTTYTLPGGIRVESHHPAIILIVDTLIDAWPRSIPVPEIGALVAEHGFRFDGELITHLFRMVVARVIQLRSWEPAMADGISERPLASATSREDAAVRNRAASLIHTVVDLGDPLVRRLLCLLDGTRDRAAIVAALHAGNPAVDADALEAGIEPTLENLYRACVLQG